MPARSRASFFAVAGVAVALAGPACAQADAPSIDWRVLNRFRLFTTQADFAAHEQAYQSLSRELGRPASALEFERRLATQSDGRGWAAEILERTCLDAATGRLRDPCRRDGVNESPVNPRRHGVELRVRLPSGQARGTCRWRLASPSETRRHEQACDLPLNVRLRHGEATRATVELVDASPPARAEAVVAVRDILIVGLGDSIASGEGNPERPVALRNDGFCFRRVVNGDQFYLPGRALAEGVPRECPTANQPGDFRRAWERGRAGWGFAGCHRSLYSHQARTALMLAIQNPRLSVTFIPLACSGATIAEGLLGSMPARERVELANGRPAPRDVEAQFSQLRNLMFVGTRRARRVRAIDLVLLSIGANDIGFSGLVANAMIAPDTHERDLLADVIVDVADARESLNTVLRADFARLRANLRPFVDGDFSRVVFTSYPHPARAGAPCPSERRGFDAHPAFTVDGQVVSTTSAFVEAEFFPVLERLATCAPGGGCTAARSERMRFVDSHQADFTRHGFCARGGGDPAFDEDCFRNGSSFRTDLAGFDNPLACGRGARQFRPYATRARWIRTPNDSYFTAMSYPDSLGRFLRPLDVHDAVWGIASVVYGGAIHPTAEGHARMADATLEAAREQLGLPAPTASVPPLAQAAAPRQ